MAETIYAHAANAARWTLTLTEPDGTAKDLTAASGLTFLAKSNIDVEDASAEITATPTVTDAANGVVTVALTPTDTGVAAGWYVWGVQLTDGAGDLWEFPDPSQEPGKLLIRSGVVTA
jgi:hypothetical protein